MRSQFDPDLVGDGAGNLFLQRQSVAKISLIACSPKMFVGRCLYQLCGNSNLVTRTEHCSFHNGIHVQLACDKRQSLARAFVGHHRSAGDHPQSADLSQIRDQFVRHAISKVILAYRQIDFPAEAPPATE